MMFKKVGDHYLDISKIVAVPTMIQRRQEWNPLTGKYLDTSGFFIWIHFTEGRATELGSKSLQEVKTILIELLVLCGVDKKEATDAITVEPERK